MHYKMQNKSNSMYGGDLLRFHVENDSNIPILKKTIGGARKSKGCSKLPELHKYIETVIEANNKCENENMPMQYKVPKEKQTTCKRLENKIKEEKFNVISNKLKNKRQTSKKYSEAVSRGVEVLHKFFSEFEDPRNFKIQNSGSHLKIERLIEHVYPNPYTINFESECQNSEIQKFSQKNKKNYLGDDTLYDVFISKVDAETQDNLENIDLVSADFQILLAERENKPKNTSQAYSFENLNRSVPLNENNNEESKHSWNASKLIQNTSRRPNVRSSYSVSNVDSRAITTEKINQFNCKESRINIRKNSFNKFTKNHSKEILSKDKKPVGEADYDLGKLKLLNSSDSENSENCQIKQSQSKNANNMTTDDFVNEISSEICNEISKTNDLNDLLQIYEVMNKATESFLYLTSVKKAGLENRKAEDLPDSQTQVDPNTKNKVSNAADMAQKNQRTEYILEKENILETKSGRLKNIEEESVNFANESEETRQKVEDTIFDANQKINEVLEFMNECISKFNNVTLSPEQKNVTETKKESSENVLKDFEEKRKKKFYENILKAKGESKKSEMPLAFLQSSSNQMKVKHSDNSLSQKTSENQLEAVELTNKNQNARIQSKRKSKLFSSVEKENPTFSANEASTSNRNSQPEPNAELVMVNNENILQVAEVLNELGGYAEETQDLNTSKEEDWRMIKSVLPLSTKVRRSLPETYKTLKNALETEEKLLKLHKPKKLVTCNSESQILIKTDPIGGYYQMEKSGGFGSGFVFCITPFTQSLTTTTVRSPSLTLSKPLPFSLIDFTSWALEPLSEIKEERTEKLFISSEPKYRAVNYNNSLKIEILLILNQKRIIYYASSVCFLSLIGFCKIEKGNSIQYSKRQTRVKPLKKYSIVNLNTPGSSGVCIRNTLAFTTSNSDLLNVTESLTSLTDKPMEALLKAIQETENVFLLQQQNNSENNRLESFCSCRLNKALNVESVDDEQEKENDKRKVQNLLLRTYRLQKKLQEYLCNMNQSLNPARFLEKELGAVVEEKTPLPDVLTTEIKTEQEPLLPNTEKNTKIDVEMVDRGTNYVPPVEEKDSQTVCEEPNELNSKNTSEEEKENENFEDDRSSTCSFKSSNDFSETNEVQNLIQKSLNRDTNREVFKRIYNQIELLKHSDDPDNLESQENKFFHDINFKEEETYHNDKLVKLNPKNPAKVLKTIFKGRKSSTELTIGLKDVPMKRIKNISVEKTKFSPNHTKISICISKENGLNISENSNAKPLSNKVSSYILDNMRPSLSICRTKTDDNVTKSSQSLSERIEDEDDDFKSAGSNIVDSSSSTSIRPENTKVKSQTVLEVPTAKSFNKHRFDFYRKMDLNVEGVKVKQKPTSSALGRLKELEPLKQALTELQIRMRSIKRDAVLNSNDFYERALKLAKMSAGYCQSCGTRAVIPEDTFGYYKTLLPRRSAQRRSRHFKTTIAPSSNFYSFRSSNAEVRSQFCDLDITGHSSFSLNRTTHSNRTVLRSLLQDMPVLHEKI